MAFPFGTEQCQQPIIGAAMLLTWEGFRTVSRPDVQINYRLIADAHKPRLRCLARTFGADVDPLFRFHATNWC